MENIRCMPMLKNQGSPSAQEQRQSPGDTAFGCSAARNTSDCSADVGDSTDSIAQGRLALWKKVFLLARPFGLRRLGVVFFFMFAQGLFQVAGVASIFPFLALAADPQRIYDSKLGRWFLHFLPEMNNGQLLAVAGVFAVGMMFLSNGFNIVSEYKRNRYAHDYGHWLRKRLLLKILDRPYSYFLEVNSAILLKKVYGDVMGYIRGVLLPILEGLVRLATSILLITVLLFVHLKIALLAAAGLCGFYIVIYFSLKKRRQEMSDEFKVSWQRCAVEIQQLFGGIKPVKVHEVESNFVKRFENPSRKIARYGAWLPVITNVPRYVIEPIAFGGIIATVVVLNLRGRDMAHILPNMGVMALAGYRLLPSLQLLYGQLTTISASTYLVDEVYEEFEKNDLEIPASKSKGAVAPLQWGETIEFSNIAFRYPEADRYVFQSLNFSIAKNTSVGFVGKTGGGKTTLLDLIMGLHKAESGTICVDGTAIAAENLSAFRAAIGYVPQDVFLTDDTIAGNIALGVDGKEVDRNKLHDAARVAQIFDFISTELEQGFDTVVGERGVRLSGGQRQRIGLARALYRNPSILIFDEATSALDIETEEKLMKSIESLSGEKTIIMIAHRLSTVRNCNQIFALEDGTIQPMTYNELLSE